MGIVAIILSIISILISFLAIIFSLMDTKLFFEYWCSNEYILLHLKNGGKQTPRTSCYISNCPFLGVTETNWYSLEVDKNFVEIVNDYQLRDGFLGGLNLQKEYDIILITRKGKDFIKKSKENRFGC